MPDKYSMVAIPQIRRLCLVAPVRPVSLRCLFAPPSSRLGRSHGAMTMLPHLNRRQLFQTAGSAGLTLLAASGRSKEPAANGPLRVHPKNPRYFADGSGKAVYLTGAHTWANLQDIGFTDPPPV